MTHKVVVRPMLGFKTELFSIIINSNKHHHTPYIGGDKIVFDRKDMELVGKVSERRDIPYQIV